MEACHLCSLPIICTWFTFVITDIRVNITQGTGFLSWTGAILECGAQNASLGRALDFEKNNSYLQKGKSYWSGSFRSPWISFVGCYQQVSDVDLDEFTISSYIRDENDDVIPAICQRISECENYFGIENDICICVEDIYRADWRNVEDQQCTSLWRGGRQEENKYFTFYKKNTLIEKKGTDLCGYVYTQRDSESNLKNTFFGKECYRDERMLCSDNEKTKRSSWNDGLNDCWNTRHVFPEANLTYVNEGSKKDGWFGAFKRVAPLPKTEMFHDSAKCFWMRRENGKVTELEGKNDCSNTREFFCVTVVVGENEVTTVADLSTQTSTEETSTNQMDRDTSISAMFTTSLIVDTAVPSVVKEGQSKMESIGLFIGIPVGVLLLLVIIVTVVICKRKHQKQKNKDRPTNVTYSYATRAAGEHVNPSDGVYSIANSQHSDGAYSVALNATNNASEGARENADDINTYGSLHSSKHQQKNEDIYDHARTATAIDSEYDTFQKKKDSLDPSDIYDHTQNVHQNEGTYDEFKGK